LPQFLALGRALHQESWFAHIRYDENRIAQFFYGLIFDQEQNFCQVASRSSILVGAIAGKLTPHWFSVERGVFDTFLYVVPEFRGSTIAFRLWRNMRDWAIARGAKELTHGVGTAIGLDGTHRFFTGVGMTHVGGIYKLKLNS
jgi:GNAT superfamily N-acetyltransferase